MRNTKISDYTVTSARLALNTRRLFLLFDQWQPTALWKHSPIENEMFSISSIITSGMSDVGFP